MRQHNNLGHVHPHDPKPSNAKCRCGDARSTFCSFLSSSARCWSRAAVPFCFSSPFSFGGHCLIQPGATGKNVVRSISDVELASFVLCFLLFWGGDFIRLLFCPLLGVIFQALGAQLVGLVLIGLWFQVELHSTCLCTRMVLVSSWIPACGVRLHSLLGLFRLLPAFLHSSDRSLARGCSQKKNAKDANMLKIHDPTLISNCVRILP